MIFYSNIRKYDRFIEKEEIIEKPSKEFCHHYLFSNNNNDEKMVWHFKITPPISSYLYAIIAGPFVELKNPKPYKNIKMSIYYRQSIVKYFVYQAEVIFP